MTESPELSALLDAMGLVCDRECLRDFSIHLEDCPARLRAQVGEVMQRMMDENECRQKMFYAQIEAASAIERKDCEKALRALAGKYPTPVEGYGTNSSWAISDLCRFIDQASLQSEVKK
jgi:hypothetical protein